jgi:hypothetical protein
MHGMYAQTRCWAVIMHAVYALAFDADVAFAAPA